MFKISIIIPTYNCEKFIEQSVLSVLSQNYSDKEIIVVDDGSTDDTCVILDPYINRGEIKYIKQENAGPTAARNKGILNATGEYITLLDSDDLLYDGCLEALTKFLDLNSTVDFLFTNYDIFDEKGIVNSSGVDTWKIFRTIPHEVVKPEEWIFTVSLAKYIVKHGSFMSTSGVTIRRSCIQDKELFKYGYYYGEDDEFYARLTYNCRSGYIDRLLSGRRNNSMSLCKNVNNLFRNKKNYIEITKIQVEYYQNDLEMQQILKNKLQMLVYDYCWVLQSQGRLEDAHQVIVQYLGCFCSWRLFELFVKNCLLKMKLVSVRK